MTVIRASAKRGKVPGQRGHQRNADLTDTWARLTKPRSRRVQKTYRSRSSYDRKGQPLNARQQQVLDLIRKEPIRTAALRQRTGLNGSQLSAVTAALCGRGLIRRASPGQWVRV